jgi:hypothetical protein
MKNHTFFLSILFLIIGAFIFSDEMKSNCSERVKKNYEIISINDMKTLGGWSCVGGGPCSYSIPTDCGTCKPITIGACGGGPGDCVQDQNQIKCICSPNSVVYIRGCIQ